MKSLTIILAAVMAVFSLVGCASATLVGRDAKDFARIVKELKVRDVPDDIIDSVYGFVHKQNARTEPSAIICSPTVGIPPAVPETPSTAPGIPVTPPTSEVPATPTPDPTNNVVPPATGTPEVPNTTSVASSGSVPPVVSSSTTIENFPPAPPAPSASTSSGIVGIPPNESTTSNGIPPSSTTPPTSTRPSASVPSSTPAESTPPAVNGAGMAHINVVALGAAAIAALY